MNNDNNAPGELTELHVHAGSAVNPTVMWEIAHDQGIKLPTKNYWEFEKLITVTGLTTYRKYLDLFHLTELIQSSPEAMEKSIYSIVSGAYRKNNITTLEIRFNPMKRNRGGERDLDHIILASIHGMEKASAAFPIKVGLILCLDRGFSRNLNEIIVRKAVKYRKRGVVGIDLAGPVSNDFKISSLVDLYKKAKQAGLGATIHTGEVTGPDEVEEAIDLLSPDRIGHGVRAAENKELLKKIAAKKIVLEVCVTSNIHTRVVKDLSDFRTIFKKLKDNGVLFTINTDGPEMLKTNLVNEYNLLLENKILDKQDIKKTIKTAGNASFISYE